MTDVLIKRRNLDTTGRNHAKMKAEVRARQQEPRNDKELLAKQQALEERPGTFSFTVLRRRQPR